MPYNEFTGEWEPDEQNQAIFPPSMPEAPVLSRAGLPPPGSIATPPFLPPSQSVRIAPRPPAVSASDANQHLSQVLSNPPQRPEPKLWQRLASGAVGGLAGYINSGPYARHQIDPSALQQNILYPGWDQKQRQWQQQVEAAKSGAQMARQEEMDQSRKQYESAQSQWLQDRSEIERLKAEAAANKGMVTVTPEMMTRVGLDSTGVPPEGIQMHIDQFTNMGKWKMWGERNENEANIQAGKNQTTRDVASGKNESNEKVNRERNQTYLNIHTARNASDERQTQTRAGATLGAARIRATGQLNARNAANTGAIEVAKIRASRQSVGKFGIQIPAAAGQTSQPKPVNPNEEIQVIRKSDRQPGRMPAGTFDPNKYELVK